MTTADHRKPIPLSVKLEACLLALGFTLDEIKGGTIRWDHMPPLGTRGFNEDGKMVPDPNDPRYIQPMRDPDHDVKTWGTKATTAGSDIANIAKAKRLERDQQEFRDRLTAKSQGERAQRKSRWPQRKFPQQEKRA